MIRILIFLSFLTIGFSAQADQCAWIDREYAERAVHILKGVDVIHSLCDSRQCNWQPFRIAVQTVHRQQVESFDGSYDHLQEVYVNDHPIDLAYTYVNGRNLAMMVGCEVTADTPASIQVRRDY